MTHCTRRRALRILASLAAAVPLACLPGGRGCFRTAQAGEGLSASAAGQPEQQLEELLGQMLLVGFRGRTAGLDAPVVRDLAGVSSGRGGVNAGGVVLFDYDVVQGTHERNIADPEQVRSLTRRLQDVAAIPPLLAVDQEGGRVQRLKKRYGFPETASAADLGAAGTETSATLRAGAAVGRTLRQAGLNLNFAPVLDVNRNPGSPAIGALGRSFSQDPERVAVHGRAFIQGLRSQGVLACAKHFPGHGSATRDSHKGLPDVSASWSPEELIPYARLLPDGEVSMVMTGHLYNAHWDARLPASLSRRVVQGMLRQELGFDGVVVTDDLDMAAVAERYDLAERILLAVNAGSDLLLFGNNLQYDPDIAPKARRLLLEHVLAGRIALDRVSRSLQRIARLKAALGRIVPEERRTAGESRPPAVHRTGS